MDHVWHWFVEPSPTPTAGDVLAALVREGLQTRTWDGSEPSGPGMVFFQRITPELLDIVRETTHHGLERVLTVNLSPSALAPGEVWGLLEAGASDLLSWHQTPQPALEVKVRFERWIGVDTLVRSPLVRNNLVGDSRPWTAVLRQLVEVAAFTEAPVLITGESGTGKELAARLIHTLDPRTQKRELVILDCTTVVPQLAGSEFFGHERGAFTGAVAAREGALALADGGTLFLDEVGELPPPLQAQLLRAVQEHTYKRVGGDTWQRTDFRLVCATNKDLVEAVARGEFRSDLYHRIACWTCRLPALRERTEDIPRLAAHFLAQLRGSAGPGPWGGRGSGRADDQPGRPLEFDDLVRTYLLTREYPGNVRDLKQRVTRISHRHVGPGPITVGDIPENERPSGVTGTENLWLGPLEQAIRRALAAGVGLKEIGQWAKDIAIRAALEEAKGSVAHAARKLGVTDRALQMRRAADRRRSAAGDNGPIGGDHPR